MRAVDIVRKIAPKARPEYVAAFERGDEQLAEAGVTANRLRLAHFLAQWAHETGGFTIARESMSYSAKRITQVFGVGKHSAAITAAEAKTLAHNPRKLAERVYGLGNPKMAKKLGNKYPGDGWKYRGTGLPQATGRWQFEHLTKVTGVNMVENPELLLKPEYALLGAIDVWKRKGLNALADSNNIREITKRINGGYNGFDDRVRWFNKIWKLIGEGVPSWQEAEPDKETLKLQQQLNQLGYNLVEDGLYGPKTRAAVKKFQRSAGLKVDGIAGPVTKAAIKQRLESDRKEVDGDNQVSDGALVGSGSGVLGVGAAGEKIVDVATRGQELSQGTVILTAAFSVLMIVGIALILWPLIRKLRNREAHE